MSSSNQMSVTPASDDNLPSSSSTSTNRPKRRTAKVDYTEKRDFDFEIPTNQQQNPQQQQTSTANGTPNGKSSGKKRGRKAANSTNSGSTTRADTPNYNEEEDNGAFPLNYQPEVKNARFSQLLDLKDAVVRDGIELILSNGEKLAKNENVYLVCEPPGEPYYVARIMGFVKKDSKHLIQQKDDEVKVKTRQGKSVVEPAEGYRFKVNWYYRSRDISKHSNDSRLLYASMHSDTCPLQSFRGRCIVKHKDEIEDFEAFKTMPNQFWFDKLFDRYMIRFYEVLPTSHLTSLPTNYYNALMKRFPYIFVEQGKSKDMLQSPKSCAKCNQWCSHSDSIVCCECQEMYHMLCLDPPLFKKPARGFAWSCIKCTKKLESQKLIPTKASLEEDGAKVPSNVVTAQPNEAKRLPLYEELAISFLQKDSDLSLQERRNQEEWVYRYLGMHAKLEDALDLQDRPYPRAASRLGSKHQLTGVQDWYGHTVKYYDNAGLAEEYQKTTVVKKKKVDGRRKKTTSEEPEEEYEILPIPQEFKDTDPSDFPPWIQERPKGYVERGGEDTATLMWKQPESQEKCEQLDQYIKNCEPIAVGLDLLPNTPNFVDRILKNLLDSNYDFDKANELNKLITRETLKEPTFSDEEIKKFEDGVRQFGSELYPVYQFVKTQPSSMIVRFYYLWKKTKNGHLIWDNFEGRRKTKSKPKEVDEVDDLGNSADDSSYDRKKAVKRSFQCKHCKTLDSIQWFRCPGQQHVLNESNSEDRVFALCMRCARLWRRYAVVWEDPNEVMRKTGQKGGNGWKKKVESELMLDSELILKAKSEFIAVNGGISTPSNEQTPSNAGRKRKQSSVEPTPIEDQLKKVKATASVATTTTTTPDGKPREKRPYHKKQFEPKSHEEKPEILVSNILTDAPNVNLQQAIVERYYHSTSGTYNSRPKFQELPNQKSPLVSQSSSKLIKPLTNSKKCAVCLDNSDPSTSLFCYGCGVNIHPQCYGIDTDDIKNPFGSYKWFCDPCSNSLNPLVSSNYKCSLCGMYNEDEIVKAGLKRTSDGKWVHVLCALFNDHIKFGNLATLQPIVGLSSAIAAKYRNGDNIKQCDVCGDKVTLSIAQQPESNVHVGFKVVGESKPDSKCVKVGNNGFGKLTPVVICGAHNVENLEVDFVSLTSQVKRYKQGSVSTALQLYIEDFKKPNGNGGLTGAQSKFVEIQDSWRILGELENQDDETDEEKSQVDESCSNCQASKTLKWIKQDGGEQICYNCYLKQQEDVEMKDVDSKVDEEGEVADKGYEQIVEVSKGPLYGGNYGIEDSSDKLVRPEDQVVEYSFGLLPEPPQNSPSPQIPQQLPFKNGTISEYRYYPPPPDAHNNAPHLSKFMNGGIGLLEEGKEGKEGGETVIKSEDQSTIVSTTASVAASPSQPQPPQPPVLEKKNSINSIMNTDQGISNGNNNNNDNKSNTNEQYFNKKMSIGSILG